MNPDDIKDLCSEIDQYEKELEEFTRSYKIKIAVIKEHIHEEIENKLFEAHPDKLQEIATALYWIGLDYSGVGTMVKEIYKEYRGRTFVPSPYYGVTCENCGNPKPISSISEYKNLQERRRRWKCICPECERIEREQRTIELEEDRARREARIYELATMPYREYLQTPEWNEKRQAALKRAKFACQLCHGGGQLHVHHRTYERRGHELNSDIIVLCSSCHAKFHDKLEAV